MSTDRYVSPLSERYASKEMQYIFSPDMKFRTWRRLWIALAETEKELGLNITQEQIDELKAHAEDINYDVAKERERQVRHDVMSHVYAYGVQCPKAKGIIHLGATSCYVGDNTDIIVMTEALKLVKKKLVNVIAELSAFADKYKDQPTLAFTHFQPAQPTTVGKRATLWTQEFLLDLEDLEYVLGTMKLLGSKGTTGTQASFLELFDGDQETIDKIDPMIAEMGVSLSFVPEDRLGMGLVGNMDLTDNMMLRSFRQGHTPFTNRKPSKQLATDVVENLEVVTPGITTPVRRLSGGNVQKVLVGREIASAPTVLLTAYVVRGLDINSSYTIYDLINEQKKKGVAVIFVGEDLDVLMELSDRIMVLCGGEVSGILDARKTDKNEVGMLMTRVGGKEHEGKE